LCVCQLFPESAALYLLDEANDEWLIRKGYLARNSKNGEQSKDQALEWSHQVESRQGNGLVRECLRTESPILARRIQENQDFDPSRDAPSGMQVNSMLCVPLISDGILLARSSLSISHQQFELFDQELLQNWFPGCINCRSQTLHSLMITNFEMDAPSWC
jgi:GAF domain-containing protein